MMIFEILGEYDAPGEGLVLLFNGRQWELLPKDVLRQLGKNIKRAPSTLRQMQRLSLSDEAKLIS